MKPALDDLRRLATEGRFIAAMFKAPKREPFARCARCRHTEGQHARGRCGKVWRGGVDIYCECQGFYASAVRRGNRPPLYADTEFAQRLAIGTDLKEPCNG